MRQLTVALLLIVAIALQSAARAVWQPLGFVDLTLILVVYFALQREALQALVVAAVAGLATGPNQRTTRAFGGWRVFQSANSLCCLLLCLAGHAGHYSAAHSGAGGSQLVR